MYNWDVQLLLFITCTAINDFAVPVVNPICEIQHLHDLNCLQTDTRCVHMQMKPLLWLKSSVISGIKKSGEVTGAFVILGAHAQ